MSSSKSESLSTSPVPESEEGEESKPLLTRAGGVKPSEPPVILAASSGTTPSGRSPRGEKQKSSLARSNLHHRSVDNQLDGSTTSPTDGSKPHKQILFRTGSQPPTPLSVHYNAGDSSSTPVNGASSAKVSFYFVCLFSSSILIIFINSINTLQTAIKEEDSPKSDANGHRFQVAKVTNSNAGTGEGKDAHEDSDDRDDDSEADNDSLRANMYATAGYDTRNLKSFKHYTREALPRVDNYRNMASIHGHSERPTLDELHGVQTTVQFDNKVGADFIVRLLSL